MTLDELIALLKQQTGASGGSEVPATAASLPSVSPSGSGSGVGAPLSSPVALSNELGLGGSEIEQLAQFLGIPTIADLQGLPTEAKTQGIASALGATGNSNDALISQFIGREVNAGNPLSSNTADNAVRRFAAMVQAITGQKAPGATATGFQNNPTFDNPALGKAIERFRIPAGYEFASDPSKLGDIYKDLSGSVGLDSSKIFGKGGEQDWQRVVRELIQQGALTRYQGPLGAAGGGNTSGGAIPNVSLPHPLAQNQPQLTPAPYPV